MFLTLPEAKAVFNSIMKIKQPAKLNLSLKITGMLPDGRHRLFSAFLPLAEPADIITLETDLPKGSLEIVCDTPGVPCDMSNLAAKAASAYAGAAAITPCWRITLEKHIPVAAGMGGGSSDAAGVLLLLNRKYGALANDQLRRIASSLGADVPYFLEPEFAFMEDAGDVFAAALPHIDLPVLLVLPGFPVSAAWAYKHFDHDLMGEAAEGYAEDFAAACAARDWRRLGELIHNDLAPAVVNKFPMLSMILETLRSSGAEGCGMTGSGPVCFAFSENESVLDEVEKKIKELFPECGILRAKCAGRRQGDEIYE